MRWMVCVVAAMVGCVEDGEDQPYEPTAADWEATGDFSAASRVLTAVEGIGPSTSVQVWYPTLSTEGERHAYVGTFTADALDAAPPACDTPRSVLVFSHGNGGTRYQSYFLAEHLASHGWIVVAPDHEANTALTYSAEAVPEAALRRPLELSQSYDLLLEDSELAGCLDASAGYAVGGHSFGGYTTLAAAGAPLDLDFLSATCEATGSWLCGILDVAPKDQREILLDDPRVQAAVVLAPAGYETMGTTIRQIRVPTLVMGGSDDRLTPWEVQAGPIYDALTASPRASLKLLGASHYGFSNACELFPTDEYCRGELSTAEVQRLTKTAVTAFLNKDYTSAELDEAVVEGVFVR